MNEEKNVVSEEVNEKNNSRGQNNNGLIIAIIVIVLMCLVGFGIYGWYAYINESDQELNTDEIFDDQSCSSCNQQISSTPDNTEGIYTNSRYGFTIATPSGFSAFESENGDGVTYSGSDSVIIRVYATNNFEGITLSQYMDQETNQLKTDTGDGTEIGINEVNIDGCEGERRTWEYTSPTNGVKTMKERSICLKDDVFYVIEFESPASIYDQYISIFDEIVFSYDVK